MIINNKNKVGIISYGNYLPSFFISGKSIAARQGKPHQTIYKSLGVLQKSVPSVDEDTTTMSVESAFQAIKRCSNIKHSFKKDSIKNNTSKNHSSIKNKKVEQKIGCLFIGSESHPYAVKPTGTMVKQALGLSDNLSLADTQFACKAGTQSLQICFSYVLSEMAEVGLAIGSDTAQSRPGDVLEYTAAAGSAAFLVGAGTENIIAKLIATSSVVTDTPDFWRRPSMKFPEHSGRFSGEPAYFYHIELSAKNIMKEINLQPEDFDYCVFHTPNAKFPKIIAKRLGFTSKQLAPSLVVEKIGNTYAAASMIALAAVLDVAKVGQKILMVSYGSGAGSDAFVFETTELLEKRRDDWQGFLKDQIEAMKEVNF